MLFTKLSDKTSTTMNVMFDRLSETILAKFLGVLLFSVFIVACAGGGKSKPQDITRMEDINMDQVEYADHADTGEDDRFSAPSDMNNEQLGDGEALDPYDNPQYADAANDPFDNPQYAEGEESADTLVVEQDAIDPYDNPQYAEGSEPVDTDTVAVDSTMEQSVDTNADDTYANQDSTEDAYNEEQDEAYNTEPAIEKTTKDPVYEQVGVDEAGQPIMAIVDPLEKFGPNPYLQNPPIVNSDTVANFSQALSLASEEKYEEAALLLEELSENNAQLSGPAYNRAVLAYKEDDMKLALEWVDIALARNAYNLDAKNLKANIFKNQAKFEAAEIEYKGIISMWGAYLPAYKNLGILYDMYMGKLALALEQYRLYDSLNPKIDKQVEGWIAVIARQMPAEPEPVPANEPVNTPVDSGEGETESLESEPLVEPAEVSVDAEVDAQIDAVAQEVQSEDG